MYSINFFRYFRSRADVQCICEYFITCHQMFGHIRMFGHFEDHWTCNHTDESKYVLRWSEKKKKILKEKEMNIHLLAHENQSKWICWIDSIYMYAIQFELLILLTHSIIFSSMENEMIEKREKKRQHQTENKWLFIE